MANIYWSEEVQGKWCIEWKNTGNTQADFSRLYKLLYPKVFKLCEAIMNRYYSVPYNRKTDLLNDCVQEVFLKLPLFNQEKSKSYSFCSMIAKHYIHEEFVIKPQWLKHPQIELTQTGEFEEYKQPLDYGESFQIDYDEVLRHFKRIRRDILTKRKAIKRSDFYYTVYCKKFNNQIMIINKAIEFIERFHSLDAAGMADYIYINSDDKLRKTTIVNYFRAIFGFTVSLRINMHSTEKGKGEDKYNFMQDDFTPADKHWARRSHRKKSIKASPERQKYLYM